MDVAYGSQIFAGPKLSCKRTKRGYLDRGMAPTKPNPRTVLFLKELYKSFISDKNFVQQRLEVEMNPVNFEFLQNYLGLFPQIPTAREALSSLATEYGIVSKNISKEQLKEMVRGMNVLQIRAAGSTAIKIPNTIPTKIFDEEEQEVTMCLGNTPKKCPKLEDAKPIELPMEFPDSQPIFEPWPIEVPDATPPSGKPKAADGELTTADPAADEDAFDEDDGRLPLTSVPWPVWQTTDQRLAEADKLIEDLEKKTGVKRRLEFDKCEEAGDELWPGVEDQASTRDTWDAMDADAEPPAGLVVKKKKRKMKKKGGRKSKRSFTLNPSPKVVAENGHDGEGARSIGVLQGGFYVANVPPARLAAINKYTTNASLKANKNDGVNMSWKKEDLGDLQRVYALHAAMPLLLWAKE
ncbi:hypothetical protein AK812_SmicGene42689 [Symbiodinium microadriaticum]|uniref:Uncharacterized protein n=1 Tax=Symbiodinium microadriaticum TaxID=2951 RepID=A0A1Q9C2Y4_SYMMI|nr:hypothetical protein AK812_SmicGene42689 [Symbiodinium microadriaticum]